MNHFVLIFITIIAVNLQLIMTNNYLQLYINFETEVRSTNFRHSFDIYPNKVKIDPTVLRDRSSQLYQGRCKE